MLAPPFPRLRHPSGIVSRSGRWRTPATLVSIVACLCLTYLIGVNLFLGTRLFRNTINGDPESFLLDYASATSFLPGRVHVEGLTIRGAGRHDEWILTIDHADVVVSLADLLRKRFHASRVRVNGFSIRVRFKMDPALATPEILAAIPPVPGFADPPYTDPGPDAPPPTDANYDKWMVDLEDVDVEHVREIWIHVARTESDSRVRGRWIFRPGLFIDVGPATVDVNALDFFYGGRLLASGVRGAVGATLHPFDLREPGLAVLEHMSTDGHVGGVAMMANTLTSLFPSSEVRFVAGEGPLEARVILDHGVFVSGTHAVAESAHARAVAEGLTFESSTRVAFDVKDRSSPPGVVASLDAVASDLRVSSGGAVVGAVASVAATLTGPRLRIAHVFDDATFAVDVHGAQTPSLSVWRSRLPPTSPIVLGSGLVTAHAHVFGSVAERSAGGDLGFSVRRLALTRESDNLLTDVSANIEVREASLLRKSVDVSAARIVLDATEATSHAILVHVPRITTKATHVRISVPNATVEGDATIVGERVTAGPAQGAALMIPSLNVVASGVAFAPAGTTGRVSIDMARATIADIHGLARVLGLPSDVDFEGGQVDAKGRVDMDLGAGSAQGEGEVVARGVRARFGATAVGGGLTAELRARRGGSAPSGSTDLSGTTVAITHGGTEKSAGDWWGTFALSDATLRTKGGLRFRANVSGTGKDASPATVLIADNTATPAWAANIFRMPNLRTEAEIRASPDSIEVRSLVSRGEGASLHMEYAKREGHHEGALLLDVGWIEMGYDLTEGKTGPVILGSEGWFAQKTAAIRSHGSAAE
jgi:hypothetical protein